MGYQHQVTTRFDLADGRRLTCEYTVSGEGDSWDTPGWQEAGEPTYTLAGREVTPDQMPKGLPHIAEALYEAGQGEYHYEEETPFNEPDDYEDY
jgi:hypothetical protein